MYKHITRVANNEQHRIYNKIEEMGLRLWLWSHRLRKGVKTSRRRQGEARLDVQIGQTLVAMASTSSSSGMDETRQ